MVSSSSACLLSRSSFPFSQSRESVFLRIQFVGVTLDESGFFGRALSAFIFSPRRSSLFQWRPCSAYGPTLDLPSGQCRSSFEAPLKHLLHRFFECRRDLLVKTRRGQALGLAHPQGWRVRSARPAGRIPPAEFRPTCQLPRLQLAGGEINSEILCPVHSGSRTGEGV
jgi:hypothetical protein